MVVTLNMSKVYSPVDDLAVAIGRKPAAVTSVPESISQAVVRTRTWRTRTCRSPLQLAHHHFDHDHGVVDQQAERDDQRAGGNAGGGRS